MNTMIDKSENFLDRFQKKHGLSDKKMKGLEEGSCPTRVKSLLVPFRQGQRVVELEHSS